MRATISLSGAALVDVGHDGLYIAWGQPVQDGAIGLTAGHPQHALAQRRDQDFRLDIRCSTAEAETADLEGVVLLCHPFARECRLEKTHHVAGLVVGALEGDVVPALDDDVRGGADAHHESTRRGLCERRHRLGHDGWPTGVGRDDGDAQPRGRRPCRGECQGREAVGAVSL